MKQTPNQTCRNQIGSIVLPGKGSIFFQLYLDIL